MTTFRSPQYVARNAWAGRKRKKAKLVFLEGTFCWLGEREDDGLARNAGFTFSQARKYWWTRDWTKAQALVQYADANTKELLDGRYAEARHELDASRATDADIDVPAPDGLEYMPFQRAGIAYALRRMEQGNGVLIGDEMGLGKTIQAIGIINALPDLKRILIVCPASLKINWQRELTKWLVRQRWIAIAGDYFPSAEIVLVNFERLHKFERALRARTWDLLVIDEAHRIKNPDARQSEHAYLIPAARKLLLTGTPIVNRPSEFWPLLNLIAPHEFGDKAKYERAYCDASPATPAGRHALSQLQSKARITCMVRRLKKDVLTELPPKMRQVIELPPGAANEQVRREQAALNEFLEEMFLMRVRLEMAKAGESDAEYTAARDELQEKSSAMFGQISVMRHQTALAKVPAVVDHVKAVLAETPKCLLFAHHHDVIDAYMKAFGSIAVKLDGTMNLRARQDSVDRFQRDPKVRLFVGSIQAAGVGITLTAASHVIFSEVDWVPGNMTQAEDRVHRIGQVDSVLVQHLVLEDSIDVAIAKKLVEKQTVIEAALDNETKDELLKDPIVPLPEGHATAHVSRSQIGREALRMDDVKVAAVAEALRVVVASNRIDAAMLSQLIEGRLTPRMAAMGRRIALRYRDQLSEEMQEALK